MLVTSSPRATCPTSCALYKDACYAENHWSGVQWDRLDRGETGATWEAFLDTIRDSKRTMWRHNEKGDLPGRDKDVARLKLKQLSALADRFSYAWTYSHKYTRQRSRQAIANANATGSLVVNLSADGIKNIDPLMQLDIGPVTVTTDGDHGRAFKTPEENQVLQCPATVDGHAWTTCEQCGNGRPWCAIKDRQFVVAFPAHGSGSKRAKASIRSAVTFEV